jgi:hypothetical protein
VVITVGILFTVSNVLVTAVIGSNIEVGKRGFMVLRRAELQGCHVAGFA